MAKILVLEDDEGIASLISTTLERSGHQVTWISAPGLYDKSEDFDLLIVDYNLSDGSTGLDFYNGLRKSGSNLPAILVTSFAEEVVLVEALRASVRDFLPKNKHFLELLPLMIERVMQDVKREHELETARRMRNYTMETHHRVKNSFQKVHSLLNIELRKHEVLDKNSVAKIISHLQGLSLIHDILTENIEANKASNKVAARDLIERLVGILKAAEPSREVNTTIDPIFIEARIASSLAVIVTELFINALKIGSGEVSIIIQAVEGEKADFKIRSKFETSTDSPTVAFVEPQDSFGLVEFLAKSDFKSSVTKGVDENSYHFCELSFPINGVESI